jgi:tetratricopeptide (TPR) repeat protein
VTSKTRFWLVAPAVLALTGGAVRPVENGLWRRVRPTAGLGATGAVRELAGQGVVLAVLGGFRGIAADALWLEAHRAWERHDLPATYSLIRMTALTDPRPLYFWLNGARIVAYDMPVWRAGMSGDLPQSVVRQIDEEQAHLALELLKLATRCRYDDPAIAIEIANIHLRRRGDVAAAADWYRRAAEMPGAPYYAGRIHAELLRSLGRKREALAWLERLLPSLPAGDPAAGREIVRERIAEYRRELAAPEIPDSRP